MKDSSQESRPWQGSLQCCYTTVARNSPWKRTGKTKPKPNKQKPKTNQEFGATGNELSGKQNQGLWKAELDDPHTDYMWTGWQQGFS